MSDVSFKGFFSIIKEKIMSPVKDPGFWFYFLMIIAGVGGLGFWINVYTFDLVELGKSLNTYFIAILATSAVDISLKEFEKYKSYKKSFQLGSYFILFIGIIIFMVGQNIWFKIAATVISWIIWWIANSDNKTILGGAPELANVTGDNKKIKGDFDNIKH